MVTRTFDLIFNRITYFIRLRLAKLRDGLKDEVSFEFLEFC